MARTRVKICGIRNEDALLAAAESGADAVGFMFVEDSPRYVDPEVAFDLGTMLPPFIATVAVVADPDADSFGDLEQSCPTSHVQLHGNESDRIVKSCGPDVIKAVRFNPDTIAQELAHWDDDENVFAILVDGSAGGAGVSFDWSLLRPHMENCGKPIILAGGLTPDNVGDAIRSLRPYGVDVSSGVERGKGIKDPALIEAFCAAVRRADME